MVAELRDDWEDALDKDIRAAARKPCLACAKLMSAKDAHRLCGSCRTAMSPQAAAIKLRAKERKRAYYLSHRAELLLRQKSRDEQRKGERREYSRQWQAAHREELRDYHRQYQSEWRARNPSKSAEYSRAYRARWPERIRTRVLDYIRAHPDEIAQRSREWRQRHPEKHRAVVRRHEALKRGASRSDFTAAQWLAIKEEYGFRCAYCNERCGRLTQDHVLALSRGGDHTASNIVPACSSCNSRKRTHDWTPLPPGIVLPESP